MSTNTDPWLQDGPHDLPIRVSFNEPKDDFFQDLSVIADEEGVEGLELEGETPQPEPVVAAPEPPPASPEPELVTETFEDGSTMEWKKTPSGWELSLDTHTGRTPEVFKGANKYEVIKKIAQGKVNATRHITKLTKELKLGSDTPARQPAPAAAPPALRSVGRELTADEKFAIKTDLATDPERAIDSLISKKTGMTLQQLAELASRGAQARTELDTESVAKAFVEEYPAYTEHYQSPANYLAIVRYLAKNKLGLQVRNSGDIENIGTQLVSGGYWTVENLGEAFEDLESSGLLVRNKKPAPVRAATPPPVAVVPTPPPAAPVPTVPQASPKTSGIPQRQGPRAGLGLRATEATASAPSVSDRPPSVEDLENLSSDEIKRLMTESFRFAQNQRRR